MKTSARGLVAGLLFVGFAAGMSLRASEASPSAVQENTAKPAVAVETMPAVHELLIRAIAEKRVLKFAYRGHARVVEPHAYGRNTKGELVLHAFQTGGGSASRPPPGWRTFAVGLIESASLAEQTFAQAREGYSPNELHLSPLWAEVTALTVEE